jgi:hypothetical protein
MVEKTEKEKRWQLRCEQSAETARKIANERIYGKDHSYLCIFNEIYYNDASDALNDIRDKAWTSTGKVVRNKFGYNGFMPDLIAGNSPFVMYNDVTR